MTPEQFTYWLQGYVELVGTHPTPEQWQSIKDHLQTVFTKVTPVVQPPYIIPTEQQFPNPLKNGPMC